MNCFAAQDIWLAPCWHSLVVAVMCSHDLNQWSKCSALDRRHVIISVMTVWSAWRVAYAGFLLRVLKGQDWKALSGGLLQSNSKLNSSNYRRGIQQNEPWKTCTLTMISAAFVREIRMLLLPTGWVVCICMEAARVRATAA